MDALSWIGELVSALGRLVPRLVIVRSTHGGVKWRRGHKIQKMAPGMHIFWPVTTEIDIIVTARQTINLPTQALTTKDGHQVVIGALVVYRIRDIIRAIGERNWDVDTTVADIGMAAVTGVVARATLAELRDIEAIEEKLTAACRRQLRRFGVAVSRMRLTDNAQCRTFKVLGDAPAAAKMDH